MFLLSPGPPIKSSFVQILVLHLDSLLPKFYGIISRKPKTLLECIFVKKSKNLMNHRYALQDSLKEEEEKC